MRVRCESTSDGGKAFDREFDLDSYDFEELPSASPCTREEARDHLQQGYAAKLPKTSYEIMWERLEEQLGTLAAADAVCELVIIALLIGGVIVFSWLGELSDAIAPRIPSGVKKGAE